MRLGEVRVIVCQKAISVRIEFPELRKKEEENINRKKSVSIATANTWTNFWVGCCDSRTAGVVRRGKYSLGWALPLACDRRRRRSVAGMEAGNLSGRCHLTERWHLCMHNQRFDLMEKMNFTPRSTLHALRFCFFWEPPFVWPANFHECENWLAAATENV